MFIVHSIIPHQNLDEIENIALKVVIFFLEYSKSKNWQFRLIFRFSGHERYLNRVSENML